MSARRYVQFLVDNQILNETLAWAYLEKYEQIRFSDDEMTFGEYKDFIKLYTALLKSIPF